MLNNPLLIVCLAIGCGALLGRITIKKVSLGVAGVLFAGLIWGYMEPAVKPLGLVVILACAGIKAGSLLHTAPLNLSALVMGAGITIATCLATIGISLIIVGKSWPFIGGILAGVQTQPAVLGFAVGRCGNERVEAGYAEAYPLSMLLKIVFVQIFLLVMNS